MDITRSRTGCWTCRSRRVKCDENRPVCQRCRRNNLSCGYHVRLTWQEDNIARGLCHGRAGVWSKADKKKDNVRARRANTSENIHHRQFPRIERARFLNTTVKDVQMLLDRTDPEEKDNVEIDIDRQEEEEEIEYPSLFIDESRHPQRALSLLKAQSKFDQYDPILLSYFEAVICSSSTLLDDEKSNPYRHVLLPMALQSPGVYHATLAISANVLRLTRSEYAVLALEHRQHALQRLITIMTQEQLGSREMDEMLGMVLMLCWYEISDGCSSSWVKHLKGFRSLINRRRQISANGSVHSLNLEQFFLRYFAFHLVLAKTAFRVDEGEAAEDLNNPPSLFMDLSLDFQSDQTREFRTPSPESPPETFSTSTSWLSLQMPLESMDDIDPYMGFSNGLLLLINEITDLVRLGKGTDDQAICVARARRLKTSLENLHQRLPESPTLGADSPKRRLAVIATGETYRLGALVLLYEIFSQSFPAALAATHVITNSELQETIQSILRTIDTHLDDMIHTAALPLWPLFLAGCCVDHEEGRVLALRLFEAIEQPRRFGNITPARKVMEMVWRQRDLASDDRRLSTKRGQYEWERASMLLGGWKISLT